MITGPCERPSLLLLLLSLFVVQSSAERPASTAYGTINTEGGCLKVRRFNEKALIANIHLLNVHLWDQVINYTCTQTQRSCTPGLRYAKQRAQRAKSPPVFPIYVIISHFLLLWLSNTLGLLPNPSPPLPPYLRSQNQLEFFLILVFHPSNIKQNILCLLSLSSFR